MADEESNKKPRKRRAAQACKACRTRKVRCDLIATGHPPGCTNCKLDGVACELMGNKRRKTVHAPHDTEPSNSHSLSNESPVDQGAPLHQIAKDDRLSSAHLVVHETPKITNGHHDVDVGVNAAFTLFSLAQPALSLPGYINRLPDSVSSEDVTFLSTKGAFAIPSRDVSQVILCRYVEFVHPALPLLDLNETIAKINDETGKSGTIGILLFMAMIYAALPFVENKHIRALGIGSKVEARTLYYKKVKMLYDFGVEPDTLTLSQVTLLMSTPHGSMDGVQDVWYWIGLSISHVHTIGIHLDIGDAGDRSSKRKLRRRIWWCLFIRENVVAMGLGRPSRITYYNVPMLGLTDFELEAMPSHILMIPNQCPVARDTNAQQQLATIVIEKAKLCICVGRAVSVMCMIRDQTSKQPSSALPRANIEAVACSKALEDWASMLAVEATYDAKPISSYRLNERSLIVARASLLMVYMDAVCLLNRPLALRAMTKSSASLSIPAEEARQLIRWAASELVRINHELDELGLLAYLDATGVANVVAAVVVNLLDVRSENERVRQSAIEALQRCVRFLRTMKNTYGSAVAAYRFLEGALKSDGCPTSQEDSPPSPGKSKMHPSEHISSIFSPEDTVNGTSVTGADMLGHVQSPPPQPPSAVLGSHLWGDDFGMEDWLRGDDQWNMPTFGTMDLPTTFSF